MHQVIGQKARARRRVLLACKSFAPGVKVENPDVVYDEDDKLKVELEIKIKQHKNC